MDGTIFSCPERVATNPNVSKQYETSFTYHQNCVWYTGGNVDNWVYATTDRFFPWKVASPSRQLYLTEGKTGQGAITQAMSTVTFGGSTCRVDFRHPGDGINVLMFDGHVEARNGADMTHGLVLDGK
jgi:prepilin-type processing-associated H-X9-DG protein